VGFGTELVLEIVTTQRRSFQPEKGIQQVKTHCELALPIYNGFPHNVARKKEGKICAF